MAGKCEYGINVMCFVIFLKLYKQLLSDVTHGLIRGSFNSDTKQNNNSSYLIACKSSWTEFDKEAVPSLKIHSCIKAHLIYTLMICKMCYVETVFYKENTTELV